MAKFLGPTSLLLVLAGLVLCQDSSNTSSTQTPVTPPVNPPVTSASTQDTGEGTNQTGSGSETTGKPPHTSTQTEITTAGAEPLNPSISDSSRIASSNTTSPSLMSTTTTGNKTMLDYRYIHTFGTCYITCLLLYSCIIHVLVKEINTAGLPTSIPTHQHTHSSITTTTAEPLNPSISDSSRIASSNTTSPSLMSTTTTGNKTMLDYRYIHTFGTCYITCLLLYSCIIHVLVKEINTAGLPTSIPTHQHTHSSITTTTAEPLNPSISDSSRIASSNTTSPSLMSTTTTGNKTMLDYRYIHTFGTCYITCLLLYSCIIHVLVKEINTAGLPTSIPTHQHTHSSITTTAAATLNASISDSSRTASSITASPSLMPNTTTVTKPECTYSFKHGKDGVEVDIKNNASAVNYINFTETSKVIPIGPWPDKLLIPFKSLKPCQNYTVTFDPPCKLGDGFFETRELAASDVTPKLNITETYGQVCFETIWALESCIGISKSNSCTVYQVTFTEDLCQTPIPFTLPPVMPVISYANKFPTELHWDNRPSQCKKNLTYKCNRTDKQIVTDFRDLKPIHEYNCTGAYDYGNGTITSKPFKVKIQCDLNNATIVNTSNTSINASWNFTSKNCSPITANFTWEVHCNGTESSNKQHTEKKGQNPIVISKLKPYTNYMCNFTAKYEKQPFHNHTIPVQTLSSEPSYTNEPKITQINHNAFKVECTIKEWNGEHGNVIAELYINDHQEDRKTSKKGKKECDLEFGNLYYSTKYNVKVYAENGNGNKTKIYDKYHSTKYNDKAVLGFLSFLIILTSVALLFVLYKLYLLKREKSSRNEQELDDLLPTNALLQVEPMSAEALLEAYKKKRADEGRLFMDEFQSIPRIFSNFPIREAKKTENQSKNRYVDILPYDHNRVRLSYGGSDDYINASFIEGYKESNKYIAAQGPKEETVGDFWTMIWEQKTSIIVMVTRCEEGNKNKCAQYWPSMERETEIFDDLVVKIKGEENCPDYIIRHLTLMNRKEKAVEREVTHIQFTSWPDHGVPSDPGLLLKLRRRVNSFKNFFSGPIVIHCSAGVGRTGTYIGIDAMIESLEAEGRVDIYGYVVKLRRQRCLMVQVEAQYVLIHTALIEYSQFGETEIPLSNFHSEVNTLRQKEGNELSLMEMEFQKLPKFRNYRSSNTARTEENKKKNRSSIVPYDFNRVPIKVNDEASHDSEAEDEEEYSSDEEDEVPTKYINASFVDGYWCPSSFIAAQGPLPDTVADFLHMLYQKQVKTVFMLSDCTENDKEFCSPYWDDEKKTFGEMVVEVKETENFPTYIRRCLEIQHTKRKDSHILQQYHFLKWAGHELPANPLDLVDMMRSVRQNNDNCSQNKNLPIVVHCNDGSSRSGIFCALWKLLDSADAEKLVDIFQVAKDLRKARLGMINTSEQYEFLYAALEVAYPVQNGEVKKPSEAPNDSVQVINESTALIDPSTDAATTKSASEDTVSASPEEGATEASSEPEKGLSESATNGPTATVEV
ncbi:receptor-type tyrosine-protein phosphatase C isoform X3 [Pangasianodon hypophthalmus]|uniref:receptor-type tyrosine-protein phosphatase C isoform X3 n=1 Tax=Pangasianodon hypophthalmus TaxID=310915 RepID=UPI002306E6A0|nr:receptor-type tyrosine-protein phosphatase C isoform X3 [Pangasianodon hypophthalmus]